MSAGRPNYTKLEALGKLPVDQRHNLPGAEERAKLQEDNARLQQENAKVRGENAAPQDTQRTNPPGLTQPEPTVDQPGTAPMRVEGKTSHLENRESTTGEAGSVDEEANKGDNVAPAGDDGEVKIDPAMTRGQLEDIARSYTTIQDPANKEKYPNKEVLYESIVSELEEN